MKAFISIFFVALIVISSCQKQTEEDVIKYVDPMIGTDATGNTFPGPSLPFGAIQLSPDTYNDRCCSGYHYTDETIIGFSHTHLSGTGCPDFGDILLMPAQGDKKIIPGSADDPDSGYRSRFKHENETASPGYYSVLLDDYNITAELTATKRVGFHRYTFPEGDKNHIILDLEHDITGGDLPLDDCFIRVISDTEVEGFRHSRGWAYDQYVYFYAEFSVPFSNRTLYLGDKDNNEQDEVTGSNVKAIFDFDLKEDRVVKVKVGISAVNAAGAKMNLDEELNHWDFDKTVNDAKNEWNEALSKIKVQSSNEKDKVKFYTAYYHALLTPNLFSDIDGKFRGMDQKIYESDDFDYYHVFSLWDTYRAVHPFFNIVDPKRNVDFIKTMIKQYEQTDLLPIWELSGCENNCMIGYHSVPVIADAYLKGYRDFDLDKAFEAMDASAHFKGEGIPQYEKYQYIPRGATSNSVSKTLEYAYDDWCIAQFAKGLGKEEKYKEYIKRSQFYRNHFDEESGLMRPRYDDGTWLEEFDPLHISMLDAGDYTEANAWQYSFYVPHAIPEHIALMGGDEAYNLKLDTFFTLTTENQNTHSDFAGKIGQYAHGNEPSHHMPYLYNYTGSAWKTQELVRKTMKELYTTEADGLCGNDDCGQLSCWYIFSSMGFYPVCPGQDMYIIGSPLFNKVEIEMPNGKNFVVEAKNNSKENVYIQYASLNGKEYPYSYIKHSDMMKGGELVLKMGPEANKDWASSKEYRPYSLPIENENILEDLGSTQVFKPFAKAKTILFDKELEVELGCLTKNVEIFYTMDGSKPDQNSLKYEKALLINTSTEFRMRAYKDGMKPSEEVSKNFYCSGIDHVKSKTKVKYLAPESGLDCEGLKVDGLYAENYTGGSSAGLIDGELGTPHFTDGKWQGFNGKDVRVVIDLKQKKNIKHITAGFLQNIGVWIFYPENIRFSISNDGESYSDVGEFNIPLDRKDLVEGVRYFSQPLEGKEARYIMVEARTLGFCPEWHEGRGGKSWIFMDEVIVE